MHKIKILFLRCLSKSLTPVLAWMSRRQPLILSGEGSALRLCDLVPQFGGNSVLIATDKVLNELGLIEPLSRRLEQLGTRTVIYDGIAPDPSFDHVRDGVRMARAAGCDSVLAVGGGSSLDTGKAIAACLTNDKDIAEMVGFYKVKAWPAPLFMIPTTAGTASEVSPGAVLTDPVKNHKGGLGSSNLFPLAAALDPGMMRSMPAGVTAATGMDALTHAVEAYLSRRSSAITDRYALAAIRLIFANLPVAHRNGDDLDARLNMAVASTYAGLAFTVPLVGYVHAISHRMGEFYHVPHGLANGVILPYVLDISRDSAQDRMAEMARAVSLGRPNDNDAELAKAFIDGVRNLGAEVGIPQTLDMIKREEIPAMAKAAMRECHLSYAPPKYLDRRECEALITRLMSC